VLGEMVAWMDESPKVGIASCGLRNNDGSLQETGGYFPTLLRVLAWMVIQDLPMVDRLIRPFHPRKSFYRGEKELDWVAGAFMMVSREVARKIKWDEDYFMYTEDVDYCFRAKRRGWKVVYWPRKAITHLGGASGTKEETILREFEGIKTFYRKHCPRWQYPVLRGLLKIGALGRMVVFGILGEERQRKVYAKAFSRA
jgi:GT2 family glycosyltransferase